MHHVAKMTFYYKHPDVVQQYHIHNVVNIWYQVCLYDSILIITRGSAIAEGPRVSGILH